MKKDLQIFKNEIFEVTIQLENGEVLFDAENVARCLGFTEVKNQKEYVMWRRVNQYLKPFGKGAETENSQDVGKGDFIPEPMVYKLAFKANNEVAERFQDWLAIEVLPSIRKHGAYLTPDKLEEVLLNPDTIIQLATKLKEEQELNKKQQQIIGELKPKADYTDRILKNKGLVTITQIAKDYGMSGQEMNGLLHDLKVQYKQSGQWLLYKDHHGKGYTHSETIDIVRSDGSPDIKMNTKWTQKGRLFLYDLLKQNNILPDIEKIA